MTTPTILALDASSTHLGYCVYHRTVLASGEVALQSIDIAVRCKLAYDWLTTFLAQYPHRPDALAIESPVSRFAKALIPQARVSGALLCAASMAGLLVVEVTPSQAKRALTGKGAASKTAMMTAAWSWYGVRGEHAADALGVALASLGMVKVEREAA